MNELIKCIKDLQLKLDKHQNTNIKEYPTRTIFIDPLLKALGWDVLDPDEVELEYPTIDGKSVDYALKINKRPVLFIEAKPLDDPLTDVKSITQVVSYSANAGIDWCILTNGITYKVYKSTEKAEAPQKLLFEVSIAPKDTEGMTIQQIAEQLSRFSHNAMAEGVLDEIGQQIFITGKVRKALDKLFIEPPNNLIRLICSIIDDDSIKPAQIKQALTRLWTQTSGNEIHSTSKEKSISNRKDKKTDKEWSEEHHLEGKPQEVVELFRQIDKFCLDLAPGMIQKAYLKMYVKYTYNNNIFCRINIRKSRLRIILKLEYSELKNPPEYIRDASKIGHWGAGYVEIAIDSINNLSIAKELIQKSFEKNK